MIFQITQVLARSYNKKIIYIAKLKPIGSSHCPKSKIYLETTEKDFYHPGEFYELDLEYIPNFQINDITTN